MNARRDESIKGVSFFDMTYHSKLKPMNNITCIRIPINSVKLS